MIFLLAKTVRSQTKKIDNDVSSIVYIYKEAVATLDIRKRKM
jgi:hypothetical protein